MREGDVPGPVGLLDGVVGEAPLGRDYLPGVLGGAVQLVLEGRKGGGLVVDLEERQKKEDRRKRGEEGREKGEEGREKEKK